MVTQDKHSFCFWVTQDKYSFSFHSSTKAPPQYFQICIVSCVFFCFLLRFFHLLLLAISLGFRSFFFCPILVERKRELREKADTMREAPNASARGTSPGNMTPTPPLKHSLQLKEALNHDGPSALKKKP
ncbi:hypothetical protein AMTRI_Chr09g18190 [Amborella trichopoda]